MKHIFGLILFFSLSVQAQFQIHGIVKEAQTSKPLPFATIMSSSGKTYITDGDGKFVLSEKEFPVTIVASYIGFQSEKINTQKDVFFYSIGLSAQTNTLNEVTIARENPAIALIKKVIEQKNNNNPQKRFKNFQFKSYNKLIVSAHPDSIQGTLDSVFVKKNNQEVFSKIDSSNYIFKKIVSTQHLFQSERVSNFQFDAPILKETIIGAKMAGFKEPIYEFIGFNLQSFSVYNDKYELLEIKYNSPINEDSFLEYNYKILEETTLDDRNVIIAYFKHKKKPNGLEGVLYIDAITFGIAKAIMRTKGTLDISGTHEMQFLEKTGIWVPKKRVFKVQKGKNEEDIKILGGNIDFKAEETLFAKRKRIATDYTYLISETNCSQFEFNTNIKIKRPSFAIEIKEDAINKDDFFWNTYRKDSLDSKEKKTYLALDSLFVKNNVEKKILLGRKVINGYLPVSFFDFDLRKIISFNNYEGFRLGMGGNTNERFSKKYKIESYVAYGLKDEEWKYRLGISSRVDFYSNSWIGISYTNDVKEIASTSFATDKKAFKIYDPRPFNLSTFYNYKTWDAYIETKIIPKTESVWQITQTNVVPLFDYNYLFNATSYTKFKMTTAMVSVQWNPFSDYMQTPRGKIEIEKRFPKFTFQFTHSLPSVFENDFDFSKFDFKTDYEITHLNGQKTALLFEAGYISGHLPLTHLYNTSPNSLTKDNVIQRITIAGKNSFETMYFNEFFSDKFLAFHFKHKFKKIIITKKVKPSLSLVSRMAWGNLTNKSDHIGLNFKTLDRGFLESGIEINQIYKGFGFTSFYRYGPNELPRFEDNLAIKLSFVFDLGF